MHTTKAFGKGLAENINQFHPLKVKPIAFSKKSKWVHYKAR
jgi:hypothetical protein